MGASCADKALMLIAYFMTKAGLIMFRAGKIAVSVTISRFWKSDVYLLPCPGTPGKTLTLYLKSPHSKAMSASKAACAPAEVIPYLWKEAVMCGSACSAVRPVEILESVLPHQTMSFERQHVLGAS